MTARSAISLLALLFLVSIAPWLARRLVRVRERADGAPSLALVRATAAVNLIFAAITMLASTGVGGRIAAFGHLWRHDAWSALLFGALAGLLLHVLGGGSPLPVAALTGSRRKAVGGTRDADGASVALFVLGEVASLVVWFGVALPTLLRWLPRLLVLPLVAGGYGVGRAAGGQDHPLTAAIDGLLLGLLYLLTGSLIAVLVAHILVDVLAYVSAASSAEDEELALEAGEPVLSPRGGEHLQ